MNQLDQDGRPRGPLWAQARFAAAGGSIGAAAQSQYLRCVCAGGHERTGTRGCLWPHNLKGWQATFALNTCESGAADAEMAARQHAPDTLSVRRFWPMGYLAGIGQVSRYRSLNILKVKNWKSQDESKAC